MTASINALPAGSDGGYYLSEYHLGEGKELGKWWGEPAQRLGLSESIDKEQFQKLLRGINPHHGKSMVKQHEGRVPALDLTFSVEKSVSVAWTVGKGSLSETIEKCGEAAIKETLGWAKDNLHLVRKGRGGVIQEKGDFLAAIFKHETNRNGDPNLHWHCVIPNLVFDGNGKASHIHSKKLFEFTRALGPMFRASFARHLREATRLELETATKDDGKKAGWFQLPGVPTELVKLWSSRKSEIDEFLIPKGLSRDSASPQFRALANTETRKAKNRLPPLDVLRERWGRELNAYGMSVEKLRISHNLESKKTINQEFHGAFKSTIKDLETARSYFGYKDIMQGVAERMQHCGIKVDALSKKLTTKIASSKSLMQLTGEAAERVFTTKSIWKAEERLLKDIDRLESRRGALVTDSTLATVRTLRSSLSAEQAKAVEKLTMTEGALRVMRGVAGAGKTFTLAAVKDSFERDGYQVVGSAISGLAKETLESEAGIKSRTIASYLYQITGRSHDGSSKPPQNPFHSKSVLIVDEASMVDLKSMAAIVQAIRRAKATIILVGDDKQLQAIGASGPFSYLVRKGKVASLDENRRQVDPEDRKAVLDLRKGNTKEALENYLARGKLTISESRPLAAKELVHKWAREGGDLFPESHSVFTQTRHEAQYLNELCQAKRLQAQQIDASRCASLGSTKFYPGDRILFNKAEKTQGIENGHRGVVVGVDQYFNSIQVRLDSPKSGRPATVCVALNRRSNGDVTLGYAATTHKMQGQTTPHSYILLGGGMTDGNMAYTQVTRGKKSTSLFIDAFTAGDQLTSIGREMKKDRSKTLAHEYQNQNSQSHSL